MGIERRAAVESISMRTDERSAGFSLIETGTLAEFEVTSTEIEPAPDGEHLVADVVGPVCETGDYLALGRDLPALKAGDLIAIGSAGAYGAVQAGTYNTRLLVPEVLVDGDRFHVVRPRGSYEELIGLDSLPDWL